MKKVQFFLIVIFASFLLLDSGFGFTATTFAQDKSRLSTNKSNDNEQIKQQIGTDNHLVPETGNVSLPPNVTVEFSIDGRVIAPTTISSDAANTGFYPLTDPGASKPERSATEYNFANPTGVSASDAGIINIINSAQVSVSGRVMTGDGRPLPRARLTLTTNTGAVFNEMTNFSGFYRFTAIPAGSDYVFSISDKHYDFSPRIISITGDLEGLDFMARVKD